MTEVLLLPGNSIRRSEVPCHSYLSAQLKAFSFAKKKKSDFGSMIRYSNFFVFPSEQNGQLWFMCLDPRMAGGAAVYWLASQHHLRGCLRPHQSPHHLPRPGPAV